MFAQSPPESSSFSVLRETPMSGTVRTAFQKAKMIQNGQPDRTLQGSVRQERGPRIASSFTGNLAAEERKEGETGEAQKNFSIRY